MSSCLAVSIGFFVLHITVNWSVFRFFTRGGGLCTEAPGMLHIPPWSGTTWMWVVHVLAAEETRKVVPSPNRWWW
ncbi:hypothetical protein C8J57DRAFT_1310198 [Mycena rebaudengoi]|nr:hypothetical protein C8J57DRAFT_1310198 [Mycena rebaudengoi]